MFVLKLSLATAKAFIFVRITEIIIKNGQLRVFVAFIYLLKSIVHKF